MWEILKKIMYKKPISKEAQIDILLSRGLKIDDKEKAKEILGDIGYYRLGFYLFPFEKSYPSLKDRTHEYIEGASLKDAVNLYYFDFDLRIILTRYLNRIEIAFHNALSQNLSLKYDNPVWFIDPSVVNHSYVDEFEKKVYTPEFKRNPYINRHHKKYKNDRFAPSWKTLEFMTLGSVVKLYTQLKHKEDKIFIASLFGIRQINTFENYLHVIRNIRNTCAHNTFLFDLRLPNAIRKGPANLNHNERSNIIGALKVVRYIVSQISKHRAEDFCNEVKTLYCRLCENSPKLKELIPDFSLI